MKKIEILSVSVDTTPVRVQLPHNTIAVSIQSDGTAELRLYSDGEGETYYRIPSDLQSPLQFLTEGPTEIWLGADRSGVATILLLTEV